MLPDEEDGKVGVSSREEATSTSQATINTTTPPTRRHSLVHRHSSAAYAMEHAPILTHPALDTTIEKPPLPPRTYKSSGSGSTDSLSSDGSPHLPVQNEQSNHTTNTIITSDSEPEETFAPLKPKPNMRFKVDVSQRKPLYSGSNTLPSSSSDGLQQTSIPEEREIVSQSSSPPPPLPPKPAAASCTCTCHHHHHNHHKTDGKRRRSHNRRHSKLNMIDGGRKRSQSSLTPQSSITSHSSINSQPSFGSDTSGIQEDHEFDSAIAMLHNAFQSLSDAASNMGTKSSRQQGSFQIDLEAIPPQPEPLAYLEPVRMSTSPQPVSRHRDQSVPSKTSQKLCRLCPPSLITSSNSSTVFASHVRHH